MKILNAIKSRMGIEVSKELKESTVYKEITLGGSLLGQLGLSNPSDLDDIIDAWANGIEVTYSLTKGKFGAINIGILESTYSDVLFAASLLCFRTFRSARRMVAVVAS